MRYILLYNLTPLILDRCQKISRQLGILSGAKLEIMPVKLRRTNRIKTIQASLSIEGNTLELNQVTHLFEGKRVVGPQKDILEATNAIMVYKDLRAFHPLSIDDFLKAHKILMNNLVDQNGHWRTRGVGVFKGGEVAHIAPPAKRVPLLMGDLFSFMSTNDEIPWLLKACIFHYEVEFIHPFADGNGRMGRLWQQLILMKEDPIFEFIPIEVLIKQKQEEYYRVLGECDQSGESTLFIEFSLEQIVNSLKGYSQSPMGHLTDSISRLNDAKGKITQEWFSRKEYLELHKNISTATASRDLLLGVKKGLLKKRGLKNQMQYEFR